MASDTPIVDVDSSAGERSGWPVPTDSMVDLRCSVVVLRNLEVLLIHRSSRPADWTDGDWVLPGGRPRPAESVGACARREAAEETGLDVVVQRCLFVLEVNAPPPGGRIVELVFNAVPAGEQQAKTMEPNRHPQFVPMAKLRTLRLNPPLAGHLAGLRLERSDGASYLGNLWRPQDLTEPRNGQG